MDSDNKKISELVQVTSLNDSDLFIVSIDVPSAPKTRGIKKSNAIVGGGGGDKYPMEARLTLETGVPISVSDQSAKATLYLTPYLGNQVAVYDGVSAWSVIELTADLSLSLAGYTAAKNYDIWVYDNAGTLTLESTIWTDDTTRATALAKQDGVYVKTGATTRRYVGTIRINAAGGQCEDTDLFRGVWNYHNRVTRKMLKYESTSHSYTTTSYRYWNNSASNRVDLIIGVQEEPIYVYFNLRAALDSGESVTATYGIDVNTSATGGSVVWLTPNATETLGGLGTSQWHYVIPGSHYVAMVEYGNATSGNYIAGFVMVVIRG